MAGRSDSSIQRFILIGLIIVGLAGTFAYLICRVLHDPEIPFLPQDERAEWIVYPRPPDTVAKGVGQSGLEALFSRSFHVAGAPPQASLHFRAFKECRIRVNGREVLPAYVPDAGWKDIGTADLSGFLKKGENRLTVQVRNKLGPPALWLFSSGLGEELRTDRSWQVSLRARPPAAAAVADDCRLHPFCEDGPEPVAAFVEKLPLVLALFGVFLLLFLTAFFTNRLPALTPGPVLVICIALWAVLFVNNAVLKTEKFSPALGFDAPSHIEYVDHLVNKGTLPLASDGWEMYQPPLYYLAAAGIFKATSLFLPESGVIVSIRLIAFLCGAGQILLAFWAARILFPGRPGPQMMAAAMAAVIPMNLYISHYISNEALSTFLVCLSIVLTLRLLTQKKRGLAGFCCLGLVVGLALLAKFTVISVLPILCLLLLWRLVTDRSVGAGRAALLLGSFVVVALGLAGWFYWRNWVHFGNPIVGNWNPESGHVWWQDPGFHTSRYYMQFGEVFLHPIYAGFYSFFDSIYSTFWGDSFCGGIASREGRPSWEYGAMAAGYLLAVPACLLALCGLVAAVWKSIRTVDLRWLVILGSTFTLGFGVIFLTFKLPFYAQSKAFYALPLLLPFSLFFAWGIDLGKRFGECRWCKAVRGVLYAWFCTLAACILLTYFVR